MCTRCRDFVVDRRRPADLILKGVAKNCRCEKECSRLVEGICGDCGHFVRTKI